MATNAEWPKEGDAVVTRGPDAGASSSVSLFPGTPQVRYQSYEAALDRARRYAARAGAIVRYTPDESQFEARSWPTNTVSGPHIRGEAV